MARLTRNHVLKRNMWTFYIPEQFFFEWERFLNFIDNDDSLDSKNKSRYKNYKISAGLRVAVKMYNNFRESIEKRQAQAKQQKQLAKQSKQNLDKIVPIRV